MATLDFLTASQLVSAEQKITHGLSQYYWSQRVFATCVYGYLLHNLVSAYYASNFKQCVEQKCAN